MERLTGRNEKGDLLINGKMLRRSFFGGWNTIKYLDKWRLKILCNNTLD